MTPEAIAAVLAVIAALLVAIGALYAVLFAVAWLDSPRQPEADRSRGTAPLDTYAQQG